MDICGQVHVHSLDRMSLIVNAHVAKIHFLHLKLSVRQTCEYDIIVLYGPTDNNKNQPLFIRH